MRMARKAKWVTWIETEKKEKGKLSSYSNTLRYKNMRVEGQFYPSEPSRQEFFHQHYTNILDQLRLTALPPVIWLVYKTVTGRPVVGGLCSVFPPSTEIYSGFLNFLWQSIHTLLSISLYNQ
jgi:hypothetical protein